MNDDKTFTEADIFRLFCDVQDLAGVSLELGLFHDDKARAAHLNKRRDGLLDAIAIDIVNLAKVVDRG